MAHWGRVDGLRSGPACTLVWKLLCVIVILVDRKAAIEARFPGRLKHGSNYKERNPLTYRETYHPTKSFISGSLLSTLNRSNL